MSSDLLSIGALLVLSACFSGVETAIFSIDRIRLRTLADKKQPSAMLVERLRQDPKRLLGTILLCNNAVNVAIAAIATAATIRTLGNAWVGAATGAVTFVLLITGEYMPKSYAAHHAERVAFLFARPLYFLTKVLAPVVRIVEGIVALFIKYDDSQPKSPLVSEDEIKTMARIGAKAGTVEHDERELIERVFLFNDITAHDVMTPSEDFDVLDGDLTLGEALPLINATKYSRYPVFEGADRKFIGVVHIKDVLERLAEQPEAARSVLTKDIAVTPMFVPETKLIDDLLRDFQKQRAHMALVINEYGTIVGLVTVDDLIEELVGEISDETDVDEHVIKRIDKQTIIAHGDAEVRDVNRFLNTRIGGPATKTISRVVIEKAGDIPSEGEEVEIADGVRAVVEEVANLRIMKVRVRKAEQAQLPA